MDVFCPRCGQPVVLCVSGDYAVCYACTAAAKAFVYVAMAGQSVAPVDGSVFAGKALTKRVPVDVAGLTAWRKAVRPRKRAA